MIAVPIFITFALLGAAFSAYIRYINSGRVVNIYDPYYLSIVFFILYCLFGQFGRIALDDFGDHIYVLTSLYAALSTVFIIIFTAKSKPKIRMVSPGFINEHGCKHRQFLLAGLLSLVIGYYFWYLNYSRLGNISDIIYFGDFNRVDRNSILTEERGNLPYTHFMHIGYSFILASYALKGVHVFRSVLAATACVSPLFLFYLLEGERTAILKYIISGFFIIGFFGVDRGFRKLDAKHVIIALLLFLSFSVLGNIRSGVMSYVFKSDSSWMVEQFEDKGLFIFVPNEFAAVNFVMNKSLDAMDKGDFGYRYGESYSQSISYLLPRFFYDLVSLEKQPTISDEFGEIVATEIGRNRKMGFGMSLMAETYINFSWMGVLLVPVFVVLLVNAWQLFISVFIGRVFALFLLLTVSPLFVFVYRSSFASNFSFLVYVAVLSSALYVLSALLLWVLRSAKPKF